MVRISVGGHDYLFRDGDILGSSGTVNADMFRRLEGIEPRHMLFIEQNDEAFFMIPRNVEGESKLDGVRIEHGTRQKIAHRHELTLNQVTLGIEPISSAAVTRSEELTSEAGPIPSGRRLGKDLGLLELVVDNIDDLIAVVDSEGNRVWNNAAYAHILGYPVEELVGSQSLIEVHPEDLSIVREAFRESMSEGASRRIEYRLRHHDGHYIYLESQGWVLPGTGDRERLLVVISRDITRRKALEREQLAQMMDAANYVRSQLPANLNSLVRTNWIYLPSTTLGGDALDFFWLDADYLVLYLLDVVGHGVGSALLAISILQLLRQRSLKGAELRDPVSVLNALNRSFQMEAQGEKVFSIWYGVYNRNSRELRYAAAGHPPALLLSAKLSAASEWLQAKGVVIGGTDQPTYNVESIIVPGGSTLLLYSDGLFELSTKAGGMLGMEGFRDMLVDLHVKGRLNLQNLLESVQQVHGSDEFEDDASILQIEFIQIEFK
jgi:PAS domain S-box-containing protein